MVLHATDQAVLFNWWYMIESWNHIFKNHKDQTKVKIIEKDKAKWKGYTSPSAE